MNDIDLEHLSGWELSNTDLGRILRRECGSRLTELAVVHVCRTIVEEGTREISASAFGKRVGRRYHRLREIWRIPNHSRPRLTVRSVERLIAFVCELPQDARYADAFEGVFVRCIEYANRPEVLPRGLDRISPSEGSDQVSLSEESNQTPGGTGVCTPMSAAVLGAIGWVGFVTGFLAVCVCEILRCW